MLSPPFSSDEVPTQRQRSIGIGIVREIVAASERKVLSSQASVLKEISTALQSLKNNLKDVPARLDKVSQLNTALPFSSSLVSSKSCSLDAAAQSITVEAFVGHDCMREISVANFLVFFIRLIRTFFTARGRGAPQERNHAPESNQDSSSMPSPDRRNDRQGQRQGYREFSTS